MYSGSASVQTEALPVLVDQIRRGRPWSGRYESDSGIAVFRGGLKNGVFTTCAGTRWRTASMVTSTSTVVPGAVCAAAIVASAMSFLSVGDHVVLVARPIWR